MGTAHYLELVELQSKNSSCVFLKTQEDQLINLIKLNEPKDFSNCLFFLTPSFTEFNCLSNERPQNGSNRKFHAKVIPTHSFQLTTSVLKHREEAGALGSNAAWRSQTFILLQIRIKKTNYDDTFLLTVLEENPKNISFYPS